MINIFEVIKPGLLTTVQDLGRKGYQKYGLAVSGAADQYAHRMANILVCNSEETATLEVTLMGLQLKVLETHVIAVTGGDLDLHINDKPARMWCSHTVSKGDTIRFKTCKSGCRAYIAAAGGVDTEPALGSRATDIISNLGGIKGRSLRKGDIVPIGRGQTAVYKGRRRRIPEKLIPEYLNNITVRVIPGPQEDAFTQEGIDTLFSSVYEVSKDSDRMACKMDGPKIEHVKSADIASEGIFFGAIQVPENGLPILFQAGRQSVGGYTKIGGVISADLPRVAQLKPGDRISFEKITLSKAHELLIEQERMFKLLNISC